MRLQQIGRRAALAALLTFATSSLAFSGQGSWQVGKMAGEVWISSSGAQKVSLTSATQVQAGDDIRTGRNGRVLLVRGEEVIMLAPNSEIAIPESSRDGMATTIVQRAGSAMFEVEKRNVQHFQVETPYLAAVVKGTQFQVSVTGGSARVNVTRGAVDVSDFKSGQHALIMPGQSARVAAVGAAGLSISGRGAHSPILQGTPRAPSVTPDSRSLRAAALRGAQGESRLSRVGNQESHKPGMRISAPIGDVKLDYTKVTKGLAGSTDASAHGARVNRTVWNSNDAKSDPAMTNANGQSASAAALASGAAAAGGGSGNGNGNSNSNAGGNGNSNGNAGGNGNGNAYGHYKNK